MKIRYYNISWNSLLDGPGHRVVLFLQGCHLQCPWCHSPHSWSTEPPLLYFQGRCLYCGKCQGVCPNRVHLVTDRKHILYRDRCQRCGNCVRSCPTTFSNTSLTGALSLPILSDTPEQLFNRLLPQLDLFHAIGGLTVSGGEPLLQYRPLKTLLHLCKKVDIHITVETNGSLPRQHFETLLPFVDCWLFGLRPVSPDICPPKTVANIATVKQNLAFLYHHNPQNITIRIPIIPGFTDTAASLAETAEILKTYPTSTIELLPMNPHYRHYYDAAGIDIPSQLEQPAPQTGNDTVEIRDYFIEKGFKVSIVN